MKKKALVVLPYVTCLLFFFLYTTLSIVRHNNYGSFGFDLGIYDQVVWEYAHFKAPITTVHHYPFTNIFTDHIEFTLVPLSVFYWIWDDPRTLLILQALFFTTSGMAIFLLARRKKVNYFASTSILIAYEIFFGVQNAMWFEVHSLSFAAAFLAWFIYFLDRSSVKLSILFFLLALLTKEDIGLLIFLICSSFLISDRKNLLKKKFSTQSKLALSFMGLSIIYSILIFYVWFPYFTADGYRFTNKGGLLSDLNPSYLADTATKRKIIFVSLASFGGLPLLAPFYLLGWMGDLAHYFILGHTVPTAQDFFMHYRISLAPLLAWPSIMTISKFKKLNKWYVGVYILVCALFFQYSLHLPLSYLAKSWFWKEPSAVKDINSIIKFIPENASVASQNNITPHISHRDQIFTLIPEKRDKGPFLTWAGKPSYLIVDTSSDFDIRHFLLNREDYIEAIKNTEKAGLIKEYKKQGSAVIYKIVK